MDPEALAARKGERELRQLALPDATVWEAGHGDKELAVPAEPPLEIGGLHGELSSSFTSGRHGMRTPATPLESWGRVQTLTRTPMADIGTILTHANVSSNIIHNYTTIGEGINWSCSLDTGGCEQALNRAPITGIGPSPPYVAAEFLANDNALGEGTFGEHYSRPVDGSG